MQRLSILSKSKNNKSTILLVQGQLSRASINLKLNVELCIRSCSKCCFLIKVVVLKKKKRKKKSDSYNSKRHFLVSLSTLTNQDRELHKAAVLSAAEPAQSRILFTINGGTRKAANSSAPGDGLYYKIGQAKKKVKNRGKEKQKRKKERKKGVLQVW